MCKEDAIILLLISIALEEISLADLIGAESEKIKCITKDCCTRRVPIQDLTDINNSVNRTIQNIIKLQMLLQFKLENVIDIVKCPKTTTSTTTTTTTTSTTTTTTTKTKTTTSSTTTTTTKSTTSTTATTTKKCKECKCKLTGRAQGCIKKEENCLFKGTAVVQAAICQFCGCIKDSQLCYSALNGTIVYDLFAFPHTLIIICPSEKAPNRIIIKGLASIVQREHCRDDITDTGFFEFTFWDSDPYSGPDSFRMIVEADNNPKLNHDSGIVTVQNSTLQIGTCPD